MRRFKHSIRLYLSIFLMCQFAVYCNGSEDEEKTIMKQVGEAKISEQIMRIIEHFEQEDPVGLPDAPVPDPMPIPPMTHSLSFGTTMYFKDISVHGLSKFRIVYIKTDLAAMEVRVAMHIDEVYTNGTYTLSSLFSRAAGPFTVTVGGLRVAGVASLNVDKGGQLSVQEIGMDVTFKNIEMNFENLGVMGYIVQGVINSLSTFVFNSIKPFILAELNKGIQRDVNSQIANIPYTFPNSISPFDMAIAEARKVVRSCGYDPYKMNDYNHTVGIFDIQLTHTWLMGLSSFYRRGDILIEVINKMVHATVDIGTQRIQGSSHWEVGLAGGIISRAGTFSFTIDSFKTQLKLNQSMDTRKHPILDDLQLELGNIQVRFDGAGTADYIIEFAINVLPNLLRYQIMDALEGPLKTRIQNDLNKITIKKMTKELLPQIDEITQGNHTIKPCEMMKLQLENKNVMHPLFNTGSK